VPTWTITSKTGPNTWSIITIESSDPDDAIARALRLIGGTIVSVE
jgi:hypothetical protein